MVETEEEKKIRWLGSVNFHYMQMRLVMILWSIFGDNWNDALLLKLWSRFAEKLFLLMGCPFQDTPSYNFGFRSSVQKNGLPGEEKHGGLVPRNDYLRNGFIPFFLPLTLPPIFCVPCLHSQKLRNRCESRRLSALFDRSVSRQFDHRSHFISFVIVRV